ncbi:Mediator of RNA polymerase II transcription subunit 6 [Nymphaea thermarum]|nr:Mediator of RNA polymerase II transcription subunit 6 [Nymphaea thermarum]
MAGTPLPPPNVGVGMGVEGAPPAAPPPPGTDMTGICFRDQLWLNTFPLDRNLVFDYFALSPFYDWSCNNEQLRMRSIHPLDPSQLTLVPLTPPLHTLPPIPLPPFLYFLLTVLRNMTGTEYVLSEVLEPHLFVIRKQKRDSPEKVTPMLSYYILDGSIYQAPQLCNVFSSRIARALYHIQKAFSIAASKLEKIGHVDSENDSAIVEPRTTVKDAIDLKEVKRVDHILGSLLRKLPPAPPPPPFPEGYTPPQASDAEKGSEAQQSSDSQYPRDPIIDEGPSKRPRLEK